MRISEVCVIGERASVVIWGILSRCFIWLPASTAASSVQVCFWKQSAAELSRRKFKNELGQCWAAGALQALPASAGYRWKSLASPGAQPALRCPCVSKGMLLDALNTPLMAAFSSCSLEDMLLSVHKLSQTLLVIVLPPDSKVSTGQWNLMAQYFWWMEEVQKTSSTTRSTFSNCSL